MDVFPIFLDRGGAKIVKENEPKWVALGYTYRICLNAIESRSTGHWRFDGFDFNIQRHISETNNTSKVVEYLALLRKLRDLE